MTPDTKSSSSEDQCKKHDRIPLIQKHENAESKSTLAAFFGFGIFVTYAFSIMLSAAEDLLTGTHIQTATVLIANRGPSSLISMIAPYFMKRIPYSVRVGFVVVLTAGGYIIAALAKQVGWKLVGVALASLGNGVASISAIALASFFNIKALSSYSSGTGFGFIGAPSYYTAITTWFCVSPKMAILFMTPFALLYLASYCVVNKNLQKTNDQSYLLSTVSVKYSELLEQNETEGTKEVPSPVKERATDSVCDSEHLTRNEKIAIIKFMFCRLCIPVFIGFFSQYILLQSVVTTISYENAPFPPRDHYQYYIFIYMIGEFLGRCHRSILGFFSSKCLYQQTSVKLWIVSMVQVIHVVFLGFESWYRFLPGAGPTMFLTLTAGLAIGVLFNNMLEYLSVALDGKEREFMLGYVSFPMFVGSLVAGLLGIYLEHVLHNHCVSVIPDSAYCLTRAETIYNITSC